MMIDDSGGTMRSGEPDEEGHDLDPTEVDVQFAFALIIALMMLFVAGFVMLMVAVVMDA